MTNPLLNDVYYQDGDEPTQIITQIVHRKNVKSSPTVLVLGGLGEF
jgi:hypothetical protein